MKPSPYVVKWKNGKPTPATNGAAYRIAVVELAQKFKPRVALELGVYRAELTRPLAAVGSIEELYAVDHWGPGFAIGVHKMEPDAAKAFMDDLAVEVAAWARTTKNVRVMRMDSLEAVTKFQDGYIDFWHTDALHNFDGVKRDIRSWWPKIRDGGVLSGDNFEIPGVQQAVDLLLPHRRFIAKGRVWVATKQGMLPDD